MVFTFLIYPYKHKYMFNGIIPLLEITPVAAILGVTHKFLPLNADLGCDHIHTKGDKILCLLVNYEDGWHQKEKTDKNQIINIQSIVLPQKLVTVNVV